MTGTVNPRVKAFCDWLDTVPPSPPFHTRPEFRFYAGMSDEDFAAAKAEMRRRAALYSAEAAALGVEKHRIAACGVPLTKPAPEPSALDDTAWRLANEAFARHPDPTTAAAVLLHASALVLATQFPDSALDRFRRLTRYAVDAFAELLDADHSRAGPTEGADQ